MICHALVDKYSSNSEHKQLVDFICKQMVNFVHLQIALFFINLVEV